MSHMVIVGGGLAAGTAAKTLVDEGFDGEVTIVTEEAHPPYQRPPLSKGYLAGKETPGCRHPSSSRMVCRARYRPSYVDSSGKP